jgi:hypothetical protein
MHPGMRPQDTCQLTGYGHRLDHDGHGPAARGHPGPALSDTAIIVLSTVVPVANSFAASFRRRQRARLPYRLRALPDLRVRL